jgi:hypothetical protein
MSLHEIFDYIWNFPVPSLWILGGVGGTWLMTLVVGLIIASEIRKEGRK